LSVQEGGSENTVNLVDADACREWHAERFAPSITALVVAGDVDVESVLQMATETLADWIAAPPPATTVDDRPAVEEPTLRMIDRPGAPQTELRLGHIGLPRLHPDYFDVIVMNAILGGVFNSRINLNLREKNAFTYGAFSSFEWRRAAGPFVVSTAVATPVTASAVTEVLVELNRMRAAEPTADELSLSTSYLDGVFPIRFETTDAIASALATLRTLRLPDDYYDTYRERIRAVTAESVARAARSHLHVDRLQVLAVGDRSQIEPTLGALELGPIVVTEDAE
jgi:zinc protease